MKLELTPSISEKNDELHITIAAEEEQGNIFREGEEIRLVHQDGKYSLIRENGEAVDAEICMNTTPDQALHLALVKASFTVRKIARNAVKAELKSPCSLVHHGRSEWAYIA